MFATRNVRFEHVQSNEDFIHNCPILHQNRAPLIIKIDQELNLVEIRSEIKDALSIHLSSHALRTDMLKRACVLDNRLTEEVRLSRIILIDGVRIDFVSTIDSDARQVSFQSTANVAIPWFLQLLEEFRDFCAHSACSLSVLWHPHTPLAQRRLGPCPHTVLHRTLLERSSNTLLSSARNKAIPRAHSLAISLPPRRSSHASTPPTKRNNTMNALRAVLMPLNSEATWGGKRVRSACAVRMKVGRCERHASMT